MAILAKQTNPFPQEDDAMATAMTPSAGEQGMTDGQIDKAVSHYRDALKKSREEIGASDEVQQVLGSKEYINEIVAVLRRRVEVISNMIRRVVKTNFARTGQQTLVATGRAVYSDDEVVTNMPKGEKEEDTVYFFTLGRYVSDDDLDKEYELRGLKPCDPYTLAAVNESDPAFADNRPNGTHWKDATGKWCFAAFNRWNGERYVSVSRLVDGWNGGWWFAGVRK